MLFLPPSLRERIFVIVDLTQMGYTFYYIHFVYDLHNARTYEVQQICSTLRFFPVGVSAPKGIAASDRFLNIM